MMFRTQPTKETLQKFYPAIYSESVAERTSDKYLYIPTYKLINGLEQNGFEIVGAKQVNSRSSREHGKHVVYMTQKQNSYEQFSVGQEKALLALTNSHDGLSSFALDTAFYRLVCSNGLMLPTSNLTSARITHKIGMQDDVITAAYKVVSSFPEQIRQINEMKQITLNRDEQIFLAESAQNLAFEEEQIELNKKLGREIAPKLLMTRRFEDKKNDLWTTFNVIQENIIKGGLRVVTENEKGERSLRKTRAVNSIDRDAKLNKELMALAQKMQSLKSGLAI